MKFIFVRRRRTPKASTTRKPSVSRPVLEQLESRLAPSATTYYVATTGSDSNSGLDSAHAFATLQHAANVAVNPGDTVHVAAGNYAGFDITAGGTAGSPISFLASPGTVINSPEAFRMKEGINIEDFNNGNPVNYVTVSGFTITGMPEAGIRAVSNDVVNSKGIVLRNNTTNANGTWGIFTSHEDNLLIDHNVTTNSQTQHGIYVSNACVNPVVTNNISYGNHDCGIHFNGDLSMGGTGLITGAVIKGNIIHDNGSGGGSAINGDGLQNSVIENNLLYNNHASGIALFQQDAAAGAINNIIANNTIVMASDARWDININSQSTGNTVFNNILLNNNSSHGSIVLAQDSLSGFHSDHNVIVGNSHPFDLVDGSGNDVFQTQAQWESATGQDKASFSATASQLFVNAGANDYHLMAGSPAIDAGLASLAGHAAPAADLEGNPRPAGIGFDVGAYEAPSPITAGVSNGVFQVTGTSGYDYVTLRLHQGDATKTDVLSSSTIVGTFANSTFTQINVALGAGNDRLTIDASRGNPIPSGGIQCDGGAGNNSLIGPSTSNTWTITATNAGNINSNVAFTNFQNLTGSSGSDAFVFNNTFGVTGAVNGGGGSNTLDYSQYTTGVTVNLTSHTSTKTGSAANIANVIGGSGDDSFTAGVGNETFTGNGGSNTYNFVANTSLGSDTINDSSGKGSISFAGTNSAVTLNLGSTAQQTVNANLKLTLSSASGILNLTGGNGNDVLTGNGLLNILRGGAGNDTLTGGSAGGVLVGGAGSNTLIGGAGRSILITGSGASTATGGAKGDIVLGGTTTFDLDNIALNALLAEWQRTDIGYSQRISDLRNGVVDANGHTAQLAWGTTVLDNGAANTLRGQPAGTPEPGGAELDWFFANLAAGHDSLPDRIASEVVN